MHVNFVFSLLFGLFFFTAFSSVLWYCWLGLLTCKNRLPYNIYCVGGDVKHCTIQPWYRVFSVGGVLIESVSCFKCLGHIITNVLSDDDIQREIRIMHTNILLQKFYNCSTSVRRVLFNTYCLCLYDVALWAQYFSKSLDKFWSCYNRCLKFFFGICVMSVTFMLSIGQFCLALKLSCIMLKFRFSVILVFMYWYSLVFVCLSPTVSVSFPLELHLTTSELWFGQEQEGILP